MPARTNHFHFIALRGHGNVNVETNLNNSFIFEKRHEFGIGIGLIDEALDGYDFSVLKFMENAKRCKPKAEIANCVIVQLFNGAII